MYGPAVQELIDELGRLPGIGPKSAQRIALHLLRLPREDAIRLARAIEAVKDRVTWCRRCFGIAERGSSGSTAAGSEQGSGDPDAKLECEICRDPRRDAGVICVVEEPRDVAAIERVREYRGLYHVLQGTISPLDGVYADKLRIRELLERIEAEQVREVILCTNPTMDGDATALYLATLLKPLPVKVTQVARGLPAGGDLEYADELTLGRALEGRRELVD